jgi:hypothetical protein
LRGRGWVRGVISKPYTLTLTLSLKGEGIDGWTPIRDTISFRPMDRKEGK